MGFVKKLILRALRRLGWSLQPIRPPPEGRVVYCAHYHGHPFKCFKGDPVTESILTRRGWDNQMEDILSRLGDRADLHVVEVGSNIGASLIPIAGRFAHLTFHCIEPVPDFFELLEENARSYRNPNVKLYRRAIGARDGEEIEIRVGWGTAGLSSLVQHYRDMGTIRVESETLDTFAGDKRLGVVKIDVDGHELNVLRGGSRVLERDRPGIFLEYSLGHMLDVNTNPDQIRDLLRSLGYNRIQVWNSYGEYLATTDSWEELEKMASETDHYVDVLLESRARG